jgi:hypothetical protein
MLQPSGRTDFFMRNMIKWVDTLYPVIGLLSVLLPLNSYQLWKDLHRPS